jgi:hypothetical protein
VYRALGESEGMRRTTATVLTTLALVGAGTTPSHADNVQVRTSASTGNPAAYLTYVDCTDLFAPGKAPGSRLNLGPYAAPMGKRSLGLVPAGTGTASGPVVEFDSLAGLRSSFSVASTQGSTGTSYVLTLTADTPAGAAWLGRRALSAPSGGWTTVSVAALSYDWRLIDASTHATIKDGGTATPGEFAAAHGDGRGIAVTGFGCNGATFNLDAISAAGATYDFEGITLTTGVSVDRQQVPAGEKVTVTGRVTDASGRVTGDPLVLESRPPGGAWSPVGSGPVLGDADGVARVEVTVDRTTELRWHRPQSQYADEGWSDTVTVTVAPTEPESGGTQAPDPKPDPKPTEEPSPAPPEEPAPAPPEEPIPAG